MPAYTNTVLESTPTLDSKGADQAVSCLVRPFNHPVLLVLLCHASVPYLTSMLPAVIDFSL